MTGSAVSNEKNKSAYLIACIVMIVAAFIQGYRTVSDLHWFSDPDFYRDLSNVQQNLYGNYGKDPNYIGAFIWYNPLLTSIESLIIKITGLPVNLVLARGGAYLNLLAPITFVMMVVILFDYKTALACLLSFLFLATGNIPGYCTGTYSPWLFPVCFAQFLFYLNIIFCYKAFSTQRYEWFFILGICIGLNFLAHTAPAALIILIASILQVRSIVSALKEKKHSLVKRFVLQGLTCFLPFIIVSLPLLYYIVGKYHLHFINRVPFEYEANIFIFRNFPDMIKANISVSFFIAVFGFFAFYKNFHHQLIRRIVFYWCFTAIFMYIYSTVAVTIDNHFKIHLPLTVPNYHYFFYLKAVQSVFFGYGLIFLLRVAFLRANGLIKSKNKTIVERINPDWLFISLILFCALVYFPFYRNRWDFVELRRRTLAYEKEKERIEMYYYIVKNIPADKVILCEGPDDPCAFPVAATARKVVALGPSYSNPYLDWEKRRDDRNNMIKFLQTGKPAEAKKLFYDYNVSFVLLTNEDLTGAKADWLIKKILFRNNKYSIMSLDNQDLNSFHPVQY